MNVENEKCVIVVDENLPLGITANTAAILGITMGMKMPAVVFFFGGGGTQHMVGSVTEQNDEGRELSIVLWHYDTIEWEKHY